MKPFVVVSSSGSNWAGGGQPPLLEAGFEVDHPVGALDSGKVTAVMRMAPTVSHTEAMNIPLLRWMIWCRTVIDWGAPRTRAGDVKTVWRLTTLLARRWAVL